MDTVVKDVGDKSKVSANSETEERRQDVEELRSKLEKSLESAYSEKKNPLCITHDNYSTSVYVIWKVDSSQYHNEYSLRRYLKAFQKVDLAFQAILKTNKWRREFRVAELHYDDEDIQKVLNTKVANVLAHRDLKGRPILLVVARYHTLVNRDLNAMTRFVVFCLEQACNRCFEEVVDNICLVFDLSGLTLTCLDLPLLKTVIWLLSHHYPERLGVCLVLNAPTIFWGFWTVVKGFLREATLAKIRFVSDSLELAQYLIPDALPIL